MCELMTIAAALVFTVLHLKGLPSYCRRSVFHTMMMFWGAALMWSVDCVASLLAGEGLLDLSREDTLLGAIILAFGLAFFAFSAWRGRHRATLKP